MSRTANRLVIVSVVGLLGLTAVAGSKRPAATITSPKRNESVPPTCEVTGKLQVAGRPLVLVRPDFGDKQYWLQPLPEVGERGLFRTEVRLGNEQAKAGSKFFLCVVVLRNQAELEFFQNRESVAQIPEGIARSEEFPIVLSKPAPVGGVAFNVQVQRPQADAKVHRLEEFFAQGPVQSRPCVLIRSEELNGEWWVQDPCEVAPNGLMKTTLHIGNDKTPSGTRFRIIVVAPRTEREAQLLKPGTSLASLPPGISRSKETVVVLENPLLPAKAGK